MKQATPVLSKPTGLYAASIAENQIKLTWNAVDGAETYTVLRSNSENGKYKIATELCTTNSFIDYTAVTGKPIIIRFMRFVESTSVQQRIV